MKRIGVLTSGGDAPGMNAAVRAVTRSAICKGYEVIGIRRGFNGLVNLDYESGAAEGLESLIEIDSQEQRKVMDEKVINLKVRDVSDIIQRGGTTLFTARCKAFKRTDVILQAKERCKQLGLDGLVVIGGDGSFRGAKDLSSTKLPDGFNDDETIKYIDCIGIPCIGIPGTIDNDISCTDYTIGYDTAMNTAMEMVDRLRDTAQSHDRCSVVQVMGRHAGWIALNVGVAVGAMAIITEEMTKDDMYESTKKEVIERVKSLRRDGKQHFIVVISEGVKDPEGIAKEIEKQTGIESRVTVLGHVQRGGSPTVRDRVNASEMGYYAVSLLEKGIGNRVVALKSGKVVDYDIDEALKMSKPFDENLYNIARTLSR